VTLRQRFVGDDTRSIITHGAALRSLVEVVRGELTIPLATGEITAPRRFVLSVPPRSILRLRFERAEVVTEGIGATRALDGHATPALEAVPAAGWRTRGADASAPGCSTRRSCYSRAPRCSTRRSAQASTI